MRTGERIKALREARGMSQRDLETASGVSKAYISQLERGDADNPSQKKLIALAAALRVSVSNLMLESGTQEGLLESTSSYSSPLTAGEMAESLKHVSNLRPEGAENPVILALIDLLGSPLLAVEDRRLIEKQLMTSVVLFQRLIGKREDI